MKEQIEAKYEKDEALTAREQKWIARMQKSHPEMVPAKKEEPAPAAPAAPTEAELLQSILAELKKQNEQHGDNGAQK